MKKKLWTLVFENVLRMEKCRKAGHNYPKIFSPSRSAPILADKIEP